MVTFNRKNLKHLQAIKSVTDFQNVIKKEGLAFVSQTKEPRKVDDSIRSFFNCEGKNFALFLIVFFLFAACSTKPTYRHPAPSTLDSNLVLPPSWAFGVLYGGYTNQAQTINRIKEIKDHNYPIDAYWIDSWFWSFDDQGEGPDKYLDFVADTIAFPDSKAMWSFMQKNNIKGGFWTWDAIQKTGNEAAFEDFEKQGFFRDVYSNTNSWHNKGTSTAMFQNGGNKEGTPTGNIDFDNPKAAAYFKQQMKHFFDEGADFIKLDRTTHMATVRTMFEISQEFGKETKGRGFMLSHAAGLETPEFKRYPTKWTSDTRSDWTIDAPLKKFNSWVPNIAFKENIAMFTNPKSKTHVIPFLTNDTGGFDMGITDKVDEELYIRWVEFSMWGPITEVFSQPENPTSNMAWNYSERADHIFREYAQLRMQLFPYIYSYAHRTRLEGKNIIRTFEDHSYQYKFGDEILVAPVYEQGSTKQSVYFPEGNWINYWTGETIEGSSEKKVSAPIDRIPLFVKAGSILPMRDYAPSIQTGTNERLTLHIYSGANSSFTLYEDDGTSNDYLDGIYAATEISFMSGKDEESVSIEAVKGNYSGMTTNRIWNVVLHTSKPVKSVFINQVETTFSQTDNTILINEFSSKKEKSNEIVITY